MSVERHEPMRVRELVRLLPALTLYLAVVGVFAVDEQVGDEGRYLEFARNLTQGFYTSRENPSLWSGPDGPHGDARGMRDARAAA